MRADGDGARLGRYVGALDHVFRAARDKHEAHHRSRAVLGEMASDPRVIGEILEAEIGRPNALGRKHYPVPSLHVAQTADFTLVANCWIPLPDGQTDLSTKSIHHHGNMLLTTVTAFGPGYEHWTFTRPEAIDPATGLYAMKLIERAPHPKDHVAFVDAFVAHCPLYPAALSITFALWSSQFRTTWRDVVKRLPLLRGRETGLRALAARVGLTQALDLKIVEYFDFYPAVGAFRGMKERVEFDLGPNEDYLHSLFHIVQRTGNERLAPRIVTALEAHPMVPNAPLVRSLLADLTSGRPIEGRLSPGHHGLPHANFCRAEIEAALGAPARR